MYKPGFFFLIYDTSQTTKNWRTGLFCLLSIANQIQKLNFQSERSFPMVHDNINVLKLHFMAIYQFTTRNEPFMDPS